MATTVDTLLVRIEADMADLKRGLEKVEKQTTNTTEKMKRAFRGVGVALASIGGAAVMGSFIKTSVQTGMAVENLRVQMNALLGSVEEGGKAFEKMTEFAAGVPFSLDQIQAGSGSLAAAANNADELRELMQITGNIAAQFNIPFEMAAENVQRALSAGAASADLFQQKGVNAFMGFQAGVSYSSAETAKVLQETFGTGGTSDGAMAEFAKTSAGVASMFGDAMFKMQRAFAEGGLNEGFQKITKALTNLATALTPVMTGLGMFANAVASVIAPAIDALANNLDILGYALAGIIGRFIMLKTVMLAAMAVGMARSFAVTAIAAHGATSALTLMQKGIVVSIAGVKGLQGALIILRGVLLTVLPMAIFAGIAWIAVKFFELKKRAGSFGEAMALLKDVFVAAFDVMKAVVKSFPDRWEAMTKRIYAGWLETLATMQANLAEFIVAAGAAVGRIPTMGGIGADLISLGAEEAAQAMEKFAEASAIVVAADRDDAEGKAKVTEATNKLKAAITVIKDLMKDTEGEEAQEVALNKVKVALDGVNTKLEETKPFYDSFESNIKSLAQGVSNSFADMLMSGKMNMESLKDVFRSFVKTMIAKAIELFIINKILGTVFGIPTTTHASGATTIGTAATGGTIQGGKPYLVGERGPELIVPNTGGTVLNAHNTKNALGGGAATIVNQTINVETGVSQTVRAEMLSLLPRFKQDTMAAVVDAKRRGGTYGQAFG